MILNGNLNFFFYTAMEIRLIVAGSRNFSDYQMLKRKLDFYTQNHKTVEIVSGTAKGADQLGERYAQEKRYDVKRFPANWEKYGNQAGLIRNEQMAKYASHAVLFWDGVSRGTLSMAKLCKQYNLNHRIVKF